MGWFTQDIATVSGITSSSTANVVTMSNKSTDPIYGLGIIGVSVTEYQTGQSWTVSVYGMVGGARYLIAQNAQLASQTAVIVPILNAHATDTHDFIGIPIPREVDFTGDSAGVGITFGAVLTATLFNHD
jgi:hypothetical protein